MPVNTPPPLPVAARPHRFRSAAVVLGIFLGDFGAHNFYLSQFKRGAGHLAMLAVVVGLFVQGNSLSRTVEHVAGIPAGLEFYILGLLALAANGLWRWVEVVIILATPEHRFGR